MKNSSLNGNSMPARGKEPAFTPGGEILSSAFRVYSARWLALGLLFMLLLGSNAYGQSTVGTIVGTATAADGSVVPGAPVTVTNEATHATRTVTTGQNGEYVASALNPGTYTVAASAPGFSSFQSTGIVLHSQQTIRTDIAFKIGSVATKVTVTGGAPVIQSEMPSIATTLTEQEINKSSSNLLGTSDSTGDSGLLEYTALLPTGHEGLGFQWSIAGSIPSETYYDVDGITSNAPTTGNVIGPSFPSFDIIQEVQYDAVDNKAELGNVLNISVITKSGTDRLQGSVFEHFGNQNLQAQNYFSTNNPPYTNNDFGGGVGGPIVKRKLYFFGAYEGVRNNTPIPINPNLPTLAFRSGDFSSLLAGPKPIIIKNPYTGQPFPRNIITPSSLLQSPQSLAAQKWQTMFYPAPNYGPPTSYVGNFRGTYPQNVYSNRFDLRIDANLSPTNTAFVRFSYNRSSPEVLDSGLPPSIAGTRVQIRKSYSGVLSDTWTITPKLLNVAKFGGTWSNNNYRPTLRGQPIIDNLGIQGFPIAPANVYGFPTLGISSITSPGKVGPNSIVDQNAQVIDQITYQKGSHTIKGGAEYWLLSGSHIYFPTFGTFGFNGSQTGFGYADFLLGLPQSTSYTYSRPTQYSRQHDISTYLQDDWRVSPKLRVSYGLRYDFEGAPFDKYNIISTFDPATGAIVVPSLADVQKYSTPAFPTQIPILSARQAGYPTRSLRNSFKAGFYPRLGFAYSFNERTVIRGGYGLYNGDLGIDVLNDLYQAPYGGTIAYTNKLTSPLPGAPCSPATPCTPSITFTNPTNIGTSKLGAVSISGIDKNLRNPFVQQWNLTIERDLGFNTGLRLSYIGSKASALLYGRNLNQVPASATVPFSQANTRYPNYISVVQESNGGSQIYNAFTAELNRRMKNNLLFDAAFTWAKNLTDDPATNAENGVVAEDTYNFHRQWGNEQYTPRLQFVSNVLYWLPIGPGQKLLNRDNLWSKILGGWQLSAAYLANTGNYLTPLFSGVDPTHTNRFAGSVSRTGVSTKPIGKRGINNWFNPAAYAIPAPGQFGNAGYGILEGPGSQVLNAALFKSFPVWKANTVEISGSFANVLNHPNFGNPDVTITDTATVGKITSMQGYFFGPRSGLLTVRYRF